MEEILTLIDQKKYFILHAPRQTGKTSCLLALRAYLNKEGKYNCVYANFEAAQMARNDIEAGIKSILSELGKRYRSAFGCDVDVSIPELIADGADKCNATESHIIIFDRCSKTDCKEKVFTDRGEFNGCKIKIWGM